jgi:hypothetical protein
MYEPLPSIELAALDGVMGGDQSTTRVETPIGTYSSSTSDYQACVNKATELAGQQHPSTRSIDPRTWFAPDGNEGARNAQTRRNITEMCGTPPR